MVTADFSENYSFAAQGFHCNNSTMHPFVAYCMKSGELHNDHLNYVSMMTLHVAVHLFIYFFIELLLEKAV